MTIVLEEKHTFLSILVAGSDDKNWLVIMSGALIKGLLLSRWIPMLSRGGKVALDVSELLLVKPTQRNYNGDTDKILSEFIIRF